MVKKLFKHEFAALGRLVLPVLCAILGTGLLTRFVFLFDDGSVYFNIVGWSSVAMMCITIIIGIVLAEIFAVVRFYRNLFSCEGYLSFTLPVTPAQHLFVKSVTAVVFQIATVITAILSASVVLVGEPLVEVVKAGVYIFGKVFEKVDPGQFTALAFEYLLIMITGYFVSLFTIYTCICLGQLAKKNRIVWSVAAYFGYYVITQIIATVFTVAGTALSFVLPMEEIAKFIEAHPYITAHTLGIGSIVLNLVLLTVYAVVCNFIMRKKLNLE